VEHPTREPALACQEDTSVLGRGDNLGHLYPRTASPGLSGYWPPAPFLLDSQPGSALSKS